ncbi:hypothetical protein PVT68_13305 [Microbulbifer bruguierae]|uniref:Uncharacterized protein n=1 Tax=Microbulbifer bruguierae TaxID=3029061 RepID=A0ABY8NA11_9GAMM|nr:DUF6515 family protein [Microbulbifer bruguierae]WGL15743.1 hypothetical protein PVT68_13305 [Microbulbifer bruguierae]
MNRTFFALAVFHRCFLSGLRAWLLVAGAVVLTPLALAQMPPPDQTSAEPDDEYQRDPDRQRQLPAGATSLTLSGNIYYYYDGYFYRPEDDGYLRVEPPLGAELTFVPPGSTGFDIAGERFFMSGTGTFYRYEPRSDRYVVTTPPYDWRRYYNGDLVGAYEDRLYGYPRNELELEELRESTGIPKALPPPAAEPKLGDDNAVPLFEADGYRDPRRRPSGRRSSPYATVRPPYDVSGERYDNRALLESACRQDAADAARRGSSQDNQRLRIYQREYRDCIQRYERQR